MKAIRQNAKLASVFLTILMLYITAPFDSVLAAMIGTEATLDSAQARQARDDINRLLLREDVQNALMVQGISPHEAKARIESLSDAEVIQIADEIDKLSAGGGFQVIPVWVAVLLLAAFLAIYVLAIWGFVYWTTSSAEKMESSDAEKSD